MRYVLKEKIWSWGDDFRIRDESGRDVFSAYAITSLAVGMALYFSGEC